MFVSRQINKSQLCIPRNQENRCLGIRCWDPNSAVDARVAVWVSTAEKINSWRGGAVTDRGVTAQKVLRGFQRFSEDFRDFQRFSEIFRIRFLIRNCQESAEKCWEVLRIVPPLSVTPLPLPKIFKIVLGETRSFSRKFRGVSAPAPYKSPAVIGCAVPRGPKDWKSSRFRSEIETLKRPISDWNFQSRLKFSSEIENKAPVVGKYQGRDWNFQSRLKLSIEIEIFNPGLKLSSVWIENVTRSSGIEFFQSQGPLG